MSIEWNTRKITLTALFGVTIFVSKASLPSPIDKMAIIIQALCLAVGSLMSQPYGATLVAAIGAGLTVIVRPSLAIFTIGFALIYGILTDGFVFILGVRLSKIVVRTYRLVAAVTLSTAITGLTSYYTTVYVVQLLPRNPILEITILVTGVISGFLGGYLAELIWRRALQNTIVS